MLGSHSLIGLVDDEPYVGSIVHGQFRDMILVLVEMLGGDFFEEEKGGSEDFEALIPGIDAGRTRQGFSLPLPLWPLDVGDIGEVVE